MRALILFVICICILTEVCCCNLNEEAPDELCKSNASCRRHEEHLKRYEKMKSMYWVFKDYQWSRTKDADWQTISQVFANVDKDIRPSLSRSECLSSLLDLKTVKNVQTAHTWLLEILVKLPDYYLKQFDLSSIYDDTFLQQLAEDLLAQGKLKAALSLLHQHLSSNQLTTKFCNILLEGVLDEMIISRAKKLSFAKRQISQTQKHFDRCCDNNCKGAKNLASSRVCYLDTWTTHYLRIAPAKVEVLHEDPFIAYYHEMLQPKEIVYLMHNAENMSRSLTGADDTVSKLRSSSTGALSVENLQNLRHRFKAVTNLNIADKYMLDVTRYNVGEQYRPHFDFAAGIFKKRDNRLTTSIFYLNDDFVGGATVFTHLRLTVKPVRGSMLMWYNLHNSLDFDYRAMHGGCKISAGEKWISVLWIYFKSQEDRLKCGLISDTYKSQDYYISNEYLS